MRPLHRALVFALLALMAGPASAQIMLVGIDTKFTIDDNGNRAFHENSGDAILFFDLHDPAHPMQIGSLPLTNSVIGPPTNLAVTPDQKLALIANSLNTVATPDGKWKPVPDDRLYVVDVAARPPRLLQTLKVGAQPSGIAINAAGTMALVANRAGKSLSVLSIDGQNVSVNEDVPMNETVTSAAFTPDGKRALVVEHASHKVAMLAIEDGHVRATHHEMPVGLWPYTVTITPDGKFGLAGITGNQGASDGNLDPVTVMDLTADPPRTVDYVTVGDAIEGLVASPRGGYAAAGVLQGSYDAPKDAWFRHQAGRVALLRITDGKVTLAGSTDVGAFPEGIAFSPDGAYVYAGNFASQTISVLHLEDGRLVDTHADIQLPGAPASLRVGSQ